MKRIIILCLAAALVASATPARAVVAIAIPSAELLERFVPPVTATAKGGPLILINTDTGIEHSIVSVARRSDDRPWCVHFDAGYCPVFYADPITQGYEEVLGLEDTVSGRSYPFYCGVHQKMTGTLYIL